MFEFRVFRLSSENNERQMFASETEYKDVFPIVKNETAALREENCIGHAFVRHAFREFIARNKWCILVSRSVQ